jgi:hypothetical protein
MTATPWLPPGTEFNEAEAAEFVRVTEDDLTDALVTGALTTTERLPYHYPPHPTGECAGCDAHAGAEAAHIMGGAAA